MHCDHTKGQMYNQILSLHIGGNFNAIKRLEERKGNSLVINREELREFRSLPSRLILWIYRFWEKNYVV